jgi:aryl-alcohol dehydrogenase-like predicted oxidoreductase
MNGPELWLGTVAFGRWGNPDHDECIEIIRRAVDHGVTTLDTAASYADGEAEEIVGKAIASSREHVAIATKYGYNNATAGATDLSTEALERSLDASLTRLGTDHVDVFFVHRVPATADRQALAESMDALVRTGKALAVGTSMTSEHDLRALHQAASSHGWVPLGWEQPPHSLFVRFIEDAILPACEELGIRVSTFAPLNGGWLTGKYRRGAPPPAGSRADSWPIRRDRFDHERPEVARKLALAEELTAVAASSGRTLEQLALDFARSRADVASVIVGARTLGQLDDLLAHTRRPLETDVAAAVDALVPAGTTVDDADVLGYRS